MIDGIFNANLKFSEISF